jgi:hypothetical protein
MVTVGAPGVQGDGVTGMHGIGVSTPRAADVAAATSGFAIDMHIPNGMMFTIGMWSTMLASGCSAVFTRLTGRTTSELGAIPKLHCIIAPMHTCIAMLPPCGGRRADIVLPWSAPRESVKFPMPGGFERSTPVIFCAVL